MYPMPCKGVWPVYPYSQVPVTPAATTPSASVVSTLLRQKQDRFVVIDGFIGGSLQSLNPADIASIEVLKTLQQQPYTVHAGANGVILVTTKILKG